jgi:outer membrane translocation and assembly module TamA
MWGGLEHYNARPASTMRHGRSSIAALAACAPFFGGCASIPAGRSAVDSVSVVGSRPLTLDPNDVSDKLATTASPKFLGLMRGVGYDYEIFDASVLARDLARVERYYRGRGFLEAHARAGRIIPVSGNHVRVEIVVDEGPPTLNRNVQIDGIDALPPAVADAVRAAAASALPRGTRFDEDAYKGAQAELARALTERAYAYAKVEVSAQADLATHSVDYTFTVRPGPPAVLGPITIVGLDPDGATGPRPQELDEPPLRRAMNLEPGEPYSSAAIDAATQALLDLEVFSAVRIVPKLADPPNAVVPLEVEVEPTRLRALRVGGGVEFDALKLEGHGLVGWEDHNFFGGLRDFSVELKPGVVLYPTTTSTVQAPTQWLPEERLRVQLRQSGFLEARTTAFVRPEFNVFPLLIPNTPSGSSVLGFVEPRGSVGLDRRFGPNFFASIQHTVQSELPFTYVGPLDAALPQIVLSVPQLITTLDFRDNTLHPHRGVYLSNDLQVAGLGGSAADVRVQPEVRGYIPLGKRVTLAARTSVGFLFPFNYGDYVEHHLVDLQAPSDAARDRDIEIVYFRGFFSGGPGTNRGFPLRGIAPSGYVPFFTPASASTQIAMGCNGASSSCTIPIGGFTLWEASVEARFEVAGPFATAIFCDAGDVSPRTANIRLDHLHLSCGAGARYDTPVGPIRLDIGYRIQQLQVLGFVDADKAHEADPSEPLPQRLFGTDAPMAISIGIGEAF